MSCYPIYYLFRWAIFCLTDFRLIDESTPRKRENKANQGLQESP